MVDNCELFLQSGVLRLRFVVVCNFVRQLSGLYKFVFFALLYIKYKYILDFYSYLRA